jgi:hypothetical protein
VVAFRQLWRRFRPEDLLLHAGAGTAPAQAKSVGRAALFKLARLLPLLRRRNTQGYSTLRMRLCLAAPNFRVFPVDDVDHHIVMPHPLDEGCLALYPRRQGRVSDKRGLSEDGDEIPSKRNIVNECRLPGHTCERSWVKADNLQLVSNPYGTSPTAIFSVLIPTPNGTPSLPVRADALA